VKPGVTGADSPDIGMGTWLQYNHPGGLVMANAQGFADQREKSEPDRHRIKEEKKLKNSLAGARQGENRHR